MTTDIQIARTDAQIAACYPVMRELRPHIEEAEFLSRIRSQQRDGYRLAYLEDAAEVVAVTGFRIIENLARDRFLYVDDLVTLAAHRSRGHGARLLGWLRGQAGRERCGQLVLDSGLARKDAHRFYQREGMTITGYQFHEPVGDGG